MPTKLEAFEPTDYKLKTYQLQEKYPRDTRLVTKDANGKSKVMLASTMPSRETASTIVKGFSLIWIVNFPTIL